MSIFSTYTFSNSHRYKYDVAFSFAEEDRAFVDRVAVLLKEKNVRLYYDDHERIKTWGKDLLVYLNEVYRTEARFCVMFISKHYKEKRWTKYETEWAKARSFFMENKEYILPFRFDEAEIPGLKDTIAYLSKEDYDERRLAQAIMVKIAQGKPGKYSLWGAMSVVIVLLLSALGISIYNPSDKLPLLQSAMKNQVSGSNSWHFKAICKDGWLSESNGPGTCSHHGGVVRYVDTVIQGESKEKCREIFRQAYLDHNR